MGQVLIQFRYKQYPFSIESEEQVAKEYKTYCLAQMAVGKLAIPFDEWYRRVNYEKIKEG